MLELDKIYNMDCIEGMKQIPDNYVDLVLTDPPYGVNKAKWDVLDIGLLKRALPEMKRICKGTVLVYASMKYLKEWLELNPHRLMFFVKDYIQIMPSPIQWSTDPILVFYGDVLPSNKPMIKDWFHMTTADTSKKPKLNHPTIKPIKPIKYLIERFSDEETIVCDPFIGSGTTALACKELNRHYMGFEINPEYYNISLQRLLNVPDRLEKWIDI